MDLGFTHGLEEYLALKQALGDSMIDALDDDIRFWINAPGIPDRRGHSTLRSQHDIYRSRMEFYVNNHAGVYELHGREQLTRQLIGLNLVQGFAPLFCNTEYDNWLGWVSTRHGWRLMQIDMQMHRVDAVWSGLDELVDGIVAGNFGNGIRCDGEGRIVMIDGP